MEEEAEKKTAKEPEEPTLVRKEGCSLEEIKKNEGRKEDCREAMW